MAKRQSKTSKAHVQVTEDMVDQAAESKAADNPTIKRLLEIQLKITKTRPYTGRIPLYVPSGVHLINVLLNKGRGYPMTKFIHLTGQEQSGKSSLALELSKQVIAMGGVVFWYNQEDGWSWDTAELFGIKEDDPAFVLNPPMLMEKCFDAIAGQVKELVGDSSPVLFVIDSLGGGLTLDRDETDVEKGRKVGDLSKLTNDFCAKTVPYLPMTHAAIVVTNHIYEQIGGFSRPGVPKKWIPKGGKAVPYRAFMEIRVSQGEMVKSSTGKILHGTVVLEMIKNKGGFKKLKAEIPMFFKQRRNRYYGFDDGLTCVSYLLESDVWKLGQRDKAKVILTHIDGIHGSAEDLRDRYMEDKDFRKSVRQKVEETFLRLNGID